MVPGLTANSFFLKSKCYKLIETLQIFLLELVDVEYPDMHTLTVTHLQSNASRVIMSKVSSENELVY